METFEEQVFEEIPALMFPRAWGEVGEIFENLNRKGSRDKSHNPSKLQLSRLPLSTQTNGITRSIHVALFENFESFEILLCY